MHLFKSVKHGKKKKEMQRKKWKAIWKNRRSFIQLDAVIRSENYGIEIHFSFSFSYNKKIAEIITCINCQRFVAEFIIKTGLLSNY